MLVLNLPDHRPLLAVLDPPALPGLIDECPLVQQLIDPSRRPAAAGQPRDLAAPPTPVLAVRTGDHAGRIEPAGEAPGDLAHELLTASVQAPEKVGLAAVSLVEGHPVEVEAMADGVVVQLQGDPPLGAVGHRVGDARLATAWTVVRPALGQVQLAVDQAVEAVAGVAQVDRDQAVLRLAPRSAPLALHARRLVPLLDVAGLVDDADGMRPGVLIADDVLESVAQEVVVPVVLAEELLEGAWCDAGVEGDRLDALLGDVGDLAGDVGGQVGAGVLAWEAVIEPLEKRPELGLERSDLGDVHARVSISL